MFESFLRFVRELYQTNSFIPLHEPTFKGNEKKYLDEVIDSTYVSSVGESVIELEQKISEYVGIEYAVAVVNCTSALHLSLVLSNVEQGTEVLTQSLNFIAGCNAISYCKAHPVFLDIDKKTLSLSPVALESFLHENSEIRDDGFCWNKTTQNRISACLPMNTYGFPCQSEQLNEICKKFNISLIEDSAESLGSFSNGKHTGFNSTLSTLSFNGNKIITTGGGGMILTDSKDIYDKAKHLSTTAKINHAWHFIHDEIGYNYRMPNLNAALGLAQFERISEMLDSKREIAKAYHAWGAENEVLFVKEPEGAKANYWLNCMIMEDLDQRNKFLTFTKNNDVMTRPSWKPMHQLDLYKDCHKSNLKNTEWIHERLINLPSTPI